ncbi:putative Nucleolar protein Nop52 [Trypanosoma vivax]|uniref:Uncharacterized protein n=1 Tax=Trypanosoma vivax (strain Y486) TaxID=1055687 RepID=G0U1E0_TRYVY|nr:hypothetical protein TRVL_07440 [Trypanosoma vivax]KAH8608874.1 putative Nucleolar protein Nop52 [Trypanosoma vivax]CCC49895.1 conserved hypothetical protein [Trypanosoma vivax Y486]
MKIKKKELRKGEAQLPINYPDPSVDESALLIDHENVRVEEICRKLAHNEVLVRDTVLSEVPAYVKHVTACLVALEATVEWDSLRLFISRWRKSPKKVDESDEDPEMINVLRELDVFRLRSDNARREQRRQEAIQRLEKERQKEARGREDFRAGCGVESVGNEQTSKVHITAVNVVDQGVRSGSMRQNYRAWITKWAEVELLLLKLARGLYFCLWHSDKPLVQHECAQRIADLIRVPQTNSAKLLMLSCIMRVLAREWRTMDRYRSDKYLAFVRKLVFEVVCLLKELEGEVVRESCDVSLVPHQSTRVAESELSAKENASAPRRRKEREVKDGRDRRGPVSGALAGDSFCRAVEEACYIFREQIVPDPVAVGLTMHICDIFLDELCRAQTSPALFITLSDRIVLYAMSRGNFVEKRVLDHFIAPIVGGVLAERRKQHHVRTAKSESAHSIKEKTQTEQASQKVGRNSKGHGDEATKNTAEVEIETKAIITALATCCRRYSVARGTAPSVRPMFSESEMGLQQAGAPEDFVGLSRRSVRRQIAQEVADVDEMRAAVAEERKKMRQLRKQERREAGKSMKRKKVRLESDSGDDDQESGTATSKATKPSKSQKPLKGAVGALHKSLQRSAKKKTTKHKVIIP